MADPGTIRHRRLARDLPGGSDFDDYLRWLNDLNHPDNIGPPLVFEAPDVAPPKDGTPHA